MLVITKCFQCSKKFLCKFKKPAEKFANELKDIQKDEHISIGKSHSGISLELVCPSFDRAEINLWKNQ